MRRATEMSSIQIDGTKVQKAVLGSHRPFPIGGKTTDGTTAGTPLSNFQ